MYILGDLKARLAYPTSDIEHEMLGAFATDSKGDKVSDFKETLEKTYAYL